MEIKNVGQLLQHFAQKAGIDSNNAQLINLLSNADLTKVTIDGDLVNALDDKLLSVDVAKDNHPEIAKVYKAQALNALDAKVNEFAAELGLVDELATTKNSYKKLEILVESLRNKAKATPATPATEALQKQVDDLLNDIKAKDAAHADELRARDQKQIDNLTDTELKTALSGVKTIYDTLAPDLRHTSLTTVLNQQLKQLDAKLVLVDGKLEPIKNDGTKLLGANHTPINLTALIDQTIAQNDLQVKTPPQPELPKERIIPAETHSNNTTVANYAKQQRLAYAENAQ